jgi:outer membrane lipoprotein-sorting protein
MLASLILALLAAPVAAQTADEVIARSLEARGGLERLKAIRSVRMTGRVSAGDRQMKTVVEAKRPALIRVETLVDGARAVQAFDGTTAWGIPPMGTGRPQTLPAEAARAMAADFDIDGPLVDYRAKGHRVELVGTARVGGREAYEIKVVRKTGGVERHFLDASSGLPVRVETRRVVRGAEIEGESEISDYREAGGLRWPFSIRSGARGRSERQTLTVETIEINPALDDARFRMPEPGAARPESDDDEEES